jgi:type II secretory pathway pseudopilin PulG
MSTNAPRISRMGQLMIGIAVVAIAANVVLVWQLRNANAKVEEKEASSAAVLFEKYQQHLERGAASQEQHRKEGEKILREAIEALDEEQNLYRTIRESVQRLEEEKAKATPPPKELTKPTDATPKSPDGPSEPTK